jgi:hypothetical protein
MQPIIDERATPAQRDALFSIMSGKNSAEGTLFNILSLIVTKIHDPVFAPFEFSFDKNARIARLVAKGVLGTDIEPIKGRDVLQYVDHIDGEGAEIFEHTYQAGRSKAWLKIKNRQHPALMRVAESFER